jgi:hypothetical protein
MVTKFGRGFFRVCEFKNTIHDSLLSTSVFIWVLCLWLSPYNHCMEPWVSWGDQVLGEGLSFLHFMNILDHIEPWLFETLIVFNN